MDTDVKAPCPEKEVVAKFHVSCGWWIVSQSSASISWSPASKMSDGLYASYIYNMYPRAYPFSKSVLDGRIVTAVAVA